jgi:hypothetical protein
MCLASGCQCGGIQAPSSSLASRPYGAPSTDGSPATVANAMSGPLSRHSMESGA